MAHLFPEVVRRFVHHIHQHRFSGFSRQDGHCQRDGRSVFPFLRRAAFLIDKFPILRVPRAGHFKPGADFQAEQQNGKPFVAKPHDFPQMAVDAIADVTGFFAGLEMNARDTVLERIQKNEIHQHLTGGVVQDFLHIIFLEPPGRELRRKFLPLVGFLRRAINFVNGKQNIGRAP